MIPKVLVAASVTPIMLAVLSHGESYGYEIVQRIHNLSDGKIQWSDGTLYPVLHRLDAGDLVSSRWGRSETGRKRKYYRITEKGLTALETEKRDWLAVHHILVKLWGPQPAFS